MTGLTGLRTDPHPPHRITPPKFMALPTLTAAELSDRYARDQFIAAALTAIVAAQWQQGRIQQHDVAADHAVRYADEAMRARSKVPKKTVVATGEAVREDVAQVSRVMDGAPPQPAAQEVNPDKPATPRFPNAGIIPGGAIDAAAARFANK